MTINLKVPQHDSALKPAITVIGVGGAGGNAVNNMITSKLDGVEFLVANTDAQSLFQSLADRKIQLGQNITQGLGAGSRPEIGRAAAEEAIEQLADHLGGTNMVFITAGMGGGTGTGGAPVIARLARERGILTVGVVTKPFHFEGVNRARIADAGIQEMQQYVDTLIVIPNQNLFRVVNEKTTFAEAFAMADQVLHSGVRGITDLMVVPGLINLDFADIRTVMSEMGKAMMGTGEAEGDQRATHAAEAAISNPLLDEVSMKGARGVLINITGGSDMTLFEVDEAANRIGQEVDPEANIIFGSTLDPSIDGRMRVSVVATGIEAEAGLQPKPVLKVVTGDAPGSAHSVPAIPNAPVGPTMPAAAAPAVVPREPARTTPVVQAASPEPVPEPFEEAGPDMAPVPAASVEPVGHRPLYQALNDEPADEIDMPGRSPVGETGDETGDAGAPDVEPPPRRGPSLLQRMTGAGKGRRQREPGDGEPTIGAIREDRADVARQPAAPPPMAAAALEPEIGPEIEPEIEPGPLTAPLQSAFDEVEPADIAPSAGGEDDLLDIPAFLRRQAN